ncbi:uncharacterized protein N7483_007215 [Penicillium malachiteum]|uniref:uncharacterized protein n=1 Tax=Penicillium malachiteum TaxID=1324776 RepID=UPI002548CA80|nr:uncharacterized protein N7483_007215 [Penicillium malachiteum]KAJ5725858.1 hypothetical protein N7483_007215 [Penicillium malachiteum]
MQSMQFHPAYSPFGPRQPRPRFCLFRPDGVCAPLIPLDELPSWLQVRSLPPEMYMGLQPVTLSFIPREGEYDIFCNHCSSSVDSTHTSVSERNSGTPSSTNSSASQTRARSCPAVLPKSMTDPDASSTSAKIPMVFPVPVTGQPPFTASLQFPFIGLYGLNIPVMTPQSFDPFTAPQKTSTSAASCASSPDSRPPEPTSSFAQIPVNQPGTPARSLHPDLDLESPESPGVRDRILEATRSAAGLADQMKAAAALATSICSMAEGSVASEISLTAAVEQLKKRMSKKYSLSRKNSIHDRKKSEIKLPKAKRSRPTNPESNQLGQELPITKEFDTKDWDIDWPDETKEYELEIEQLVSKPNSQHSSSRVHKVHSAVRRHAKFHRRRRRADKLKEADLLLPIDAIDEAMLAEKEAKPEQPNSSTKRRERRERLADRLVHGSKDADPKSRYWHMVAPNRHDNMRHN